jgi:esterase/lipase superfamily enzyme
LKTRIYESDDKDLFVFVHGFHNTFEDAAFRTAQIAHDLKFQGAPVFFSWPSQGTVLNYAGDENNVRVAIADLKLFLQRLRDQSGAERIHLIAHSMGSRALTNAIAAISAELGDGPVFNELVLAAPDIDSKVLDQMAESIAGAVDRITLYASSKDEALAASRFVHGRTYQRAGEAQPLPLVNEWIQTIDVSSVTSGHSYIADDGQVLSDLNDLLTRSREISEINAVKIAVGDGYYWELR